MKTALLFQYSPQFLFIYQGCQLETAGWTRQAMYI